MEESLPSGVGGWEWFEGVWRGYVKEWGSSTTTRVLVPWVIMMVVFWSYSLFFMLVDIFHYPKWLYQRKHQPTRPLKPQGCQYQPSLFKAFCVVLFNQLFIILPGLLLLDRWTKSGALLPGVVVGIRMEEELPDIYELIWTFGGALVGSEVGFFYSHYLLHHPKLYAPIHKIHHEFKATTGMAALYAHPIEAFFGNTLAVMGPAFFLNFHGLSWYFSMVVGMIYTINAHSGYKLPWNLDSDFHDLHHEFFNYNFGTFSWLDRLHGTIMLKKKKRENHKKQN